MLPALREREVVGRAHLIVPMLQVFDYDKDGGLTTQAEYKLFDQSLIVSGSLFDAINKVLPFEQWGSLFMFKVANVADREVIFEESDHDDADICEYVREALDYRHADRIRQSPTRVCLELHKRWP